MCHIIESEDLEYDIVALLKYSYFNYSMILGASLSLLV